MENGDGSGFHNSLFTKSISFLYNGSASSINSFIFSNKTSRYSCAKIFLRFANLENFLDASSKPIKIPNSSNVS